MPQLTRRVFLAAAGFSTIAAAPKPAAPAGLTAGALLPLSGGYSLVGDETLRGIQLAADAINEAGGIAGRPLTLATGDAFDQSQSAAAAHGLIAAAHPALIFGSGASALSYPGSAAAELAQLPYIELNAPADGICARGFRFLLRTGLTTTMIAQTAAALAANRHANAKIGLLFNTGATGGAIAAAILTLWSQAKTPPLIVIGYPADQVDMHEPVSRLKRAGADLVLHAADPADALVFEAALQDTGWSPIVIGCGDGYLVRETAYAIGPSFDGTGVIGAPFYDARSQYIADAYQARYGMAPRAADSLTAFVGAKLVFDILNNAAGDPSRLLDALRRTSIPPGTLANGWGVAFDKTGQNTASFATAQQWLSGALTSLT